MSDAAVPHRAEPSTPRTRSGANWLKRALDSDIFYSFRRSRMTMVAAAVTALFFLLAILASQLSVQNVDIPIMAAYLLMVSLIFVTINLVVDILYTVVDPRLRSTISRPA